MTIEASNVFNGVVRYPLTGIKVVIVGAGLSGMFAALECWRKGHQVEVIERDTSVVKNGDIFGLGPHAWSTVREYPAMFEEWNRICYKARIHVCAQDGSLVLPPLETEWERDGVAKHVVWPLEVGGAFFRSDVALMFFAQCQRLGIPFSFGVHIAEYSDDDGLATAHANDGRQFSGHVVIAADGLGTKSHSVVLGHPTRAVGTGYCVDRVAYSTKLLKDAPCLNELVHELKLPQLRIYNGFRSHIVLFITKDRVAVNSTHEDDGTAAESWSTRVTPEQVAAAVPPHPNWDPLLMEAIYNTPPESVVRWKLCLRDPQPKWTSASGRIIQIGDAAHSLLPTSTNGAAMALEDSISLAECLRLGGKEHVGLATRVHQVLRYQRTTLVQHCGFVNRRELHNSSMEEVASSGNAPMYYGKWLWTHNAEKYATDNFDAARRHVEFGAPFQNTNLPQGHVFNDWTMETELEKEKTGVFVQDLKTNGEWGLV
ncbi:hypothetical protein FSOLCH5_013692 [Fusarium solani]